MKFCVKVKIYDCMDEFGRRKYVFELFNFIVIKNIYNKVHLKSTYCYIKKRFPGNLYGLSLKKKNYI